MTHTTTTTVTTGIGLKVKNITPYFVKSKVIREILDQVGEFIDAEYANELRRIYRTGRDEKVVTEDVIYQAGYNSSAEFLMWCDVSDIISCGKDLSGDECVFFARSMPWERVENEPESIDEVYSRIVEMVQRVTNMTADQIADLIIDGLVVTVD